MERLNDIMHRTASAQRRQQAHKNQSDALAASQGPRPQPLTPRRPLPDRTARLDQPRGGMQPPQQSLPPAQASQRPTTPAIRNGSRQYGYPYRQPYPRANQPDEGRNASRQAYPPQSQPISHPQSQPRPQYREQRYVSDEQFAPPMPMPITGDYYEGYPPQLQADVQETWNEDGASMIYGDWEGEEDNNGPSYTQEAMPNSVPPSPYAQWSTTGAFARQQHRDPLVTRQLLASQHYGFEHEALPPFSDPAHLPTMQSGRGRERERDEQPIQRPPLPSPSQIPTQEARHVYRNTQPLNPRVAARMNGSAAQSRPSPETPGMQQPARQVFVPEPGQAMAQSLLTRKEVCPKCHGAGYLRLDVPVGHPNFGKPVPCECKEAEWKEKRRQELFELSDLSTFEDKSFSNFMRRFSGAHPSVELAFEAAYSFAQEPDGWLLLVGPNGCGKTHLAVAVANYCLRDGAVVLFSVVPDLLAHLRATFSPSATEAYDQRFAKMREAELLILDDLGAHQTSPWASEKLFQLLNYRYNARFPTIITANRQGLATVDERILSRLSDTALVNTVVMDGARDYRRQNPRRETKR